jgi:Na+-driven multidrug efflux pump
MNEQTIKRENPLGAAPVGSLLKQFAIPSIVAMLVTALYNIVDQFFIGRSVGELGNAATNIAFPLTTSCVAIALLFGIGGASAFNLAMGEGDKKTAAHYIGNAAVLMFAGGVVMLCISQLFLEPMLRFFGSPEEVLEYAKQYTRIVSIGFPFAIMAPGGGHLIRADGRPKVSMVCNLTGAIINIVLDAVFVFGLQWGMQGAALATVIGQVVSFILSLYYLCHYQTVPLKKEHLRIRWRYASRVMSLGTAACINQIAFMIVQILMNKTLKYYGSMSIYGESIPIACVGIISKVNMLYFSFIIGISQGLQPIFSFNYGAEKYERVKEGFKRGCQAGAVIAVIAFLAFQLAPRQIIAIFGEGSPEYFEFGIRYFRIFMFFTFINFLQPITSNFFTAIGKPQKGTFLSMTRQVIFLIPLMVVLPLIVGIDGVMYAGFVSDGMAGLTAIIMLTKEFRLPKYKTAENQDASHKQNL